MNIRLVPVSRLPLERYAPLLGHARMEDILLRVAELRGRLAGRVVWNVSSTAVGGGVAEMVRSLLAYARGAGVDARWALISGPPDFFHLTKRLHNSIHGSDGDGSPLGDAERRLYQRVSDENAVELAPLVRPRDVVILHDPQPAGLTATLARRGAHVIWRCHVGYEHANAETERGWSFLLPWLAEASACVFSLADYPPPQLDAHRVTIVTPSIDPFSAKNQHLDEGAIRSILVRTGLLAGPHDIGGAVFTREDGAPGRVDRYADVVREGGPLPPDAPLVVQVSRWDRLKDPVGVMRGFARIRPEAMGRAALLLVGADVHAVADDPDGAAVYSEAVEAWHALPDEVRAHVQLVSLPTADVEENAAIVNALQRHAAILVQKSLREGFGLTVTEALWKRRPVVASAVGGIREQIDDGVEGLLLRDPADLDALAAALARLLADPRLGERLGEAGHARVRDRYLGIDSLLRYGALIERLDEAC